MEQLHIFNIQHFSVHDGPGVRSVIFFKGCNLRCRWCHNPESLSISDQIMLYPEKCIGCGDCVKICPNKCHTFDDAGVHLISRIGCEKCFACCKNCYAEALVRVGEVKSTDFILEEIRSNRAYFEHSGGGVTFSGGECMLQIDGLYELLKLCHEDNIHTAGNVPWGYFERILSVTDLFLYDIKAFDSENHKKLTGVTNELILSNFRKLVACGANVLVRIPYVPGYNDEEVCDIANFLSSYPKVSAELLPFHAMGNSKYAALGGDACADSYTPDKELIAQIKTKYHFL